MKYINLLISKPASYFIILAHLTNLGFAQSINGAQATGQDARLTLSGIDGTAKYNETVCPGFSLCFDVFSFGGNQTKKADMFWDQGIPSAAFMVSNDDMPVGHFCWTPSLADARTTPYLFHVTMKTDADEKVFTYSITIPLLRVDIRTSDVTCSGNSDGKAEALVTGGSGSYIYQWNNHEETSSSINGLSEGEVTVQVMDDYGCETEATARIYSPRPLVLEAVSKHITCALNGGEAEILASGGTMPYTYSWLPENGATEKMDNLPSGVYTAVVTDANGCAAYKQVNISTSLPEENASEKKEMVASALTVSNVLVYPNPTHDVFTVKNISEKTITVSVVNSLGQSVYNTINIPANLGVSIPMEDQSNGIYLVKVQQAGSIEMVRLIKN